MARRFLLGSVGASPRTPKWHMGPGFDAMEDRVHVFDTRREGQVSAFLEQTGVLEG